MIKKERQKGVVVMQITQESILAFTFWLTICLLLIATFM